MKAGGWIVKYAGLLAFLFVLGSLLGCTADRPGDPDQPPVPALLSPTAGSPPETVLPRQPTEAGPAVDSLTQAAPPGLPQITASPTTDHSGEEVGGYPAPGTGIPPTPNPYPPAGPAAAPLSPNPYPQPGSFPQPAMPVEPLPSSTLLAPGDQPGALPGALPGTPPPGGMGNGAPPPGLPPGDLSTPLPPVSAGTPDAPLQPAAGTTPTFYFVSLPTETRIPTPGPSPTPLATETPVPSPTVTLGPLLPTLDLTIRATDPGGVRLAAGKVQLIEFFAYWCGRCKGMAPLLNRLEHEYAGRMNFIYLDIDDPAIKEFKKILDYRTPPHFFLLNADGKILWQASGYISEEKLRQAVGAALQ